MADHDDHIQETWNLTRPSDGDQVVIDLWTDDYSVRVEGGDGEDSEAGRTAVDRLLSKYKAAGYQLNSTYKVNDPHVADAEPETDEPANKPEACPECGATDFDFAPNHVADLRQGGAWLCTGCRWGQWATD